MVDSAYTEEALNKSFVEWDARNKLDPFPSTTQPWVIMDRLLDVILAYVRGPVLEIGIGLSTIVLAKHADMAGVPFISCDKKPARCAWAKVDVLDKHKYGGMRIYEGRSFEILSELEASGTRLAVAFVDGDHHAKVLREEVDRIIPLLLPGGVMFMHDTCPLEFRYIQRKVRGGIMDTHVVRKELEQREGVDVLTWRYSAAGCGLTMVLKKDMTEPEYRT